VVALSTIDFTPKDSGICLMQRGKYSLQAGTARNGGSMSVIAWSDDFVTGLAVVDRQHRRLVELINRLGEALSASPRTDDRALKYAYERLRDHTTSHFSDEERLMANAGIDSRHCETHRQAHAQLLDLIESLWRARSVMSNPAEALLDVVSPWFVQHTLAVDKSMALQIKLLRGGESAERSFEIASAAQPSEPKVALGALRQLFQTVSRQNLALEQSVRERTQELERTHIALEEAHHRLDHQDQDREDKIRLRTKKLERANRALSAANHRLMDIARTDGLLRIANRISFDERLEAEWRRARRDGKPLSLLMIDVDHFKRFNDTYGHPAGDRCLQNIAQIVTASTHRPADFVARYGGEELVVLLPDTDYEGARLCSEQICKRVREMDIAPLTAGSGGCVTVSVGVSSGVPGQSADSTTELLKRADQALYRAKSEGRDRVCCFRAETAETPSPDGAFGARPPDLPRLSLPSTIGKGEPAFST